MWSSTTSTMTTEKKIAHEDGDDDDEDEDESELDDEEPTSMKHAWSGMGTDDDAAGGNRYVDISKLDDADGESDHPRQSTILGTDRSEGSGDDPIRLYLREIGRENLLTAEQEVELSKKMEDGALIIQEVIQESGIMITRFYEIIRTLNTKIEGQEEEYNAKDFKELVSNQKRYTQNYKEPLKDVQAQLRSYIAKKEQMISSGIDVLNDEGLAKTAPRCSRSCRRSSSSRRRSPASPTTSSTRRTRSVHTRSVSSSWRTSYTSPTPRSCASWDAISPPRAAVARSRRISTSRATRSRI